jgi:hypothetical protein
MTAAKPRVAKKSLAKPKGTMSVVKFEEPSETEQGQSETKASTKAPAPREIPPEDDEFSGQIEKTMEEIEDLKLTYNYNLHAKNLTEQV